MPSIFVFLQLQSTCTGIVQDIKASCIEKQMRLQSTCTGIVQVQFQTGTSCFSFVAIYMHGYSARAALKIWQKVTQVAIYMHGYSASIESSERSASIRVAIYMQGYSASQTAYFGYIPFVKLQSTCMGIAQAVERKCFL